MVVATRGVAMAGDEDERIAGSVRATYPRCASRARAKRWSVGAAGH